MCGLTAIVTRSAGVARSIESMTEAVRHRGPDDEGYVLIGRSGVRCLGGKDTPGAAYNLGASYSPTGKIAAVSEWDCEVALGHRRLSIVDLSGAGHQPFAYESGRYWITYNGEIYNYVELRAELEAQGRTFLSSTDTEVVLAAYAEWGSACLERFNGMWGFVIYDRLTRRIFAARDRFGVKPLYYWGAPEGSVCFVSEIKQLSRAHGWVARRNAQRAYDFLVWGALDHTDETLFEGVFQLSPGCLIDSPIDDLRPDSAGRLSSKPWYILTPGAFVGSLEEAAHRFRELFFDSVRLRLRADVPVGSCLSGGLDSSSIVCTMNQLLRDSGSHALQRSFSAFAEAPKEDESLWIRQVVKSTGVTGYSVTPRLDGAVSELALMTWHQDEPFGSTSIYAQWSVFGLAAQHGVKVLLDGQGADEYLAGYKHFFGPRLANLWKTRGFAACLSEMRLISKRHGYPLRLLLAYLANEMLPSSARNALKGLAGYTHERPDWINLEVLGAKPQDPNKNAHYGNSIQNRSIAQLTAAGLRKLLHWEDRSSMAFSLESRVPFLDYRLVEFGLGLPDEYKIGAATTKRVLREAMQGILPEPVRTRVDKVGFATPESKWFADHNGLLSSLLTDSVDRSRGVINQKAISNMKDSGSGRRRFDHVPWRVISYGVWLDTFAIVG